MKSREIFLHSYIHSGGSEFEDEPGMDYRMGIAFIKNLSLLNNQGSSNILVHQQSCGGDWSYGMAMYDSIVASLSSVTVLAYGQARSMSSITLQAADLRVLMPDCDVLLHHGTLGIVDRATPVISNMFYYENHDKPRMLEIYARRCVKGKYFKNKKMSKSEVIDFISQKLMEKTDWILPAEEAVYYGLADGVLGTKGFETYEKIRKTKIK